MKNHILITGAHRSGSTWVGDVISASQGINYVHEPFNIGIKVYKSPFKYWFEHIDEKNTHSYQKAVKDYLLSFGEFPRTRFFVSAFRIGAPKYNRNLLNDLRSAFFSKRILIKDPLALMSAKWFYENFDSKVLITVRHPAAFIASLKVKNWKFDFNNFLSQHELMKSDLKPFFNDIEELVNNQDDIIQQGIVLWNSIYSIVKKRKEEFNDKWYFVRHEDLSMNPILEFENIFKYLELDFNEKIKDKIIATTTSKSHEVGKRDSKKNIDTWKKRLTLEEIESIKTGCFSTWGYFYTENDW